MPGCVVNGCMNYDRKCNKKIGDISYHRFPTDPVRNEVWSRIIRQQRAEPHFKSNVYLRVCSAHFTADDFYTTKSGFRRLKTTAIPNNKVQTFRGEEKHSAETYMTNTKEEDLMDVDVSDMQSIFYTPCQVILKRKLKKYMLRNFAKSKKIKSLQKQITRLKKRNESLTNIIKELRKKGFISAEIEAVLGVTPERAEGR